LSALVGISLGSAVAVDHERAKGPFTSASDAVVRLFEAKLSKKQIETLINAGALDSLLDAASAEIRYDLLRGLSQMGSGKTAASGPSLLDVLEVKNETIIDAMRRDRLPMVKKARSRSQPLRDRVGQLSLTAEVQREIEAHGFRLNRHPAIEHELLAYRINASPIASLKKADVDTAVTLIAQIEGIYPVRDRRPAEIGSEGVEVVVSDQTGRTTIYATTPAGLPEEGEIAVIRIETKRTGKIMKDWTTPTTADRSAPAAVILTIDKNQAADGAAAMTEAIKDAVRTHGRNGGHRLILYFAGNDGEGTEIRTPIARVNPTPALVEALGRVHGVTQIAVKDTGDLAVTAEKKPAAAADDAFTKNAECATLF
jgi:DNA polymerase III alpha subunit